MKQGGEGRAHGTGARVATAAEGANRRPAAWFRRALASLRPHPDERLAVWQRPGAWWWIAVLVGTLIRAHFVLFTEGTYDVAIWRDHAEGVWRLGLSGYYHANPEMNHPPFVSGVISGLWRLAEWSGLPFRVLLRAPFACLDAGTAALLLLALRKRRFTIAAIYWTHPLAMIFSAYHGNTDSSIAFFLLLCVCLLARGRVVWAGVVLGISLWIKVPGALAIPAIVFFLPDTRRRVQFLTAAFAVGIASYVPALVDDPAILMKNVFGYRGQMIQTTGGVPVWGIRSFFPALAALPDPWPRWIGPPLDFFILHNTVCTLVPMLVWSFLRRSQRSFHGLAVTVAGNYCMLYGLSAYWSFQYFAWSVPFWLIASALFSVPASLLAGGYIYGLYWLVSGNPWLVGRWDFIGHPYWPALLVTLRDTAILFFLIASLVFLGAGVLAQRVASGTRKTR